MVSLGLKKHLGLVLQAPERLGVDNAVGIPLEGGADVALLLRPDPAPALGGLAGQRRQRVPLPRLHLFSQRHKRPLPIPDFRYDYLYEITARIPLFSEKFFIPLRPEKA